MTPIDLLNVLKGYVEQVVSTLVMPVKMGRDSEPLVDEDGNYKFSSYPEKVPGVYLMNLPDVKAQREKAPYIVLQLVNGIDEQDDGKPEESSCNIRIVVCAYSEDLAEGPLQVMNVIDRLRKSLLEDRIIGKRYELQMPLEYLLYPDNPAPFYFGEIMTRWKLPAVQRRVYFE